MEQNKKSVPEGEKKAEKNQYFPLDNDGHSVYQLFLRGKKKIHLDRDGD
ncbi:MAG: hypothetical protein AB2693_30510 [Candidatus Thiodiazotropha sp.]